MSKSDEFHDQRIKLSDPLAKPDVPEFAERIALLEHVRHQFQPMFLNAIGGPDIYGPKMYIGLDIRCPFCQFIQPLVPPGQEGTCSKCRLKYKYTAAKGNCWLWIWRAQPKLDVDGITGNNPDKAIIDIPVGEAVEVHRSFKPETPRNPNKSNNNQSGFIVNTAPRKKDVP